MVFRAMWLGEHCTGFWVDEGLGSTQVDEGVRGKLTNNGESAVHIPLSNLSASLMECQHGQPSVVGWIGGLPMYLCSMLLNSINMA